MTTDPSNSNNQPTDEQRWRDYALKAQAGDKLAYNQLLKEISSFTQNYILRSLANPEWAEDIAQDVLLSVHKSLNTYSPDRPFRPWLMSIIHFRRTDFLRKHYSARQNRQTTLDDFDFQKAHVTNPAHAGEYKDIEAALQTLPKDQRTVFEMIKIHGYSTREVAGKTGMSESAVKVSAHRTAKKLKEILG
ncbi:MAG: sigma-70 family RNA polymerase sigma factor [Rhodospirillales bacterium]|nr:sigma-70 family RNA polymerase sigma factor [Rhodospirillales bacterium]